MPGPLRSDDGPATEGEQGVAVPDGEDLAAEAAAATAVGGAVNNQKASGEEAGDWPDCGWQAILPTMAEHVIAEHLWEADPDDTRWPGGNNPGYDVVNSHERVDAKAAWYGSGSLAGRLCFAAPEQFDADRVDAIAPVVLSNPKLHWASCAGGGGRVVGGYDSAEMWKIPVAEANRLMRRHSKARSSISLDEIKLFKRR